MNEVLGVTFGIYPSKAGGYRDGVGDVRIERMMAVCGNNLPVKVPAVGIGICGFDTDQW